MTAHGKWSERFEQGRPALASVPTQSPAPASIGGDEREEDSLALDLSVYRPWVIQRGRSRPAVLLDLRRYDAKSGMWMGWQMAYPHLVAAEYVGDRMLSLDFGTRQFMIEGRGLDALARHLQQGTVLAIQEYSEKVWPTSSPDGSVTRISKIEPDGAPR